MGPWDARRSDPRLASTRSISQSSAGSGPGKKAMLVLVPAGWTACPSAKSHNARTWILVLAGSGTALSRCGGLVLCAGHLARLTSLSGPVVAGPRGLACLIVTTDPDPTRPVGRSWDRPGGGLVSA